VDLYITQPTEMSQEVDELNQVSLPKGSLRETNPKNPSQRKKKVSFAELYA